MMTCLMSNLKKKKLEDMILSQQLSHFIKQQNSFSRLYKLTGDRLSRSRFLHFRCHYSWKSYDKYQVSELTEEDEKFIENGINEVKKKYKMKKRINSLQHPNITIRTARYPVRKATKMSIQNQSQKSKLRQCLNTSSHDRNHDDRTFLTTLHADPSLTSRRSSMRRSSFHLSHTDKTVVKEPLRKMSIFKAQPEFSKFKQKIKSIKFNKSRPKFGNGDLK